MPGNAEAEGRGGSWNFLPGEFSPTLFPVGLFLRGAFLETVFPFSAGSAAKRLFALCSMNGETCVAYFSRNHAEWEKEPRRGNVGKGEEIAKGWKSSAD